MQAYNQIDQRIHQLCQIIAKANRTYVPKVADDSHTNLYYDEWTHRIYGRWITLGTEKIILALNLSDFQLEWWNDRKELLQIFAIDGKTPAALEQEIEEKLADLGLVNNNFRSPLHFEIQDYPFLNEPFQKFSVSSLETWEAYRRLANQSCYQFLGYIQTPGALRIWPHHFDTGIYVEPNPKIGFGVGLAMEDPMVGSPYFYFSGYGLNGKEINYTQATELTNGQWIIDGPWKGAVLAIKDLEPSDTAKVQLFLQQASQFYFQA